MKSRFVGAVIGALLAVGVVSAGWAFAQTDSTTPTTEAPSQATPSNPAAPDDDCPLHQGRAGRPPAQAPAQGSSTTADPAAEA